MKSVFVLFVLCISSLAAAQDLVLSERELQEKLDSVITEGNLLYKYEKAAWTSTDLALADKKIKKNYGDYLTYQTDNGFKAIILGKNGQTCIGEYEFVLDFENPDFSSMQERDLNSNEKILLGIRKTMLAQLKNYDVSVPKGYALNMILIPFGDEYKLYVITATSQSNVIPFGNDYLFIADKNGRIQSWQKFHSRLIPGNIIGPNGEKVVMLMHSHLRTTPFITATDICTFKLYAPLCSQNEFSVYSPAIQKHMKYSLDSNSITLKE